jgi:OmpA-like transmembrane domain
MTMGVSASAEGLLGLYVGGAAGAAHVRSTDDEGVSYLPQYSLRFDESRLGWKAFAGIRPISFAGVEIDYMDFGRAHAPLPPNTPPFFFLGDDAKQSAAAAFAVGYLPIPLPILDIFAKVGIARLHSEDRVTFQPEGIACPLQLIDPSCGQPYTYRQNLWSTDLAYGVGAQVHMGNFSVRAEYERINASGGDPDLLSLGGTWRF